MKKSHLLLFLLLTNSLFLFAKPSISTVKNNQILRYPLVLIGGEFDGKKLSFKLEPKSQDISSTILDKNYRALVKLKEGKNTLYLQDKSGMTKISLTYQKPSTEYRLKVWYAVPKGENPDTFTKHGNNANYTKITPFSNSVERVISEYKEKIGVQVMLMQSWSAEDMLKAGYGRKTFYPIYNKQGDIDVGLIELDKTREEIVAGGRGIFGEIIKNVPKKYKNGKYKNLCFSAVRASALGGGDFCMVGSKTIVQTGPTSVKEIYPSLLDNTRYDNLSWREYVGVTIHELGHQMHSAWHPGGRNHIMQSAYGNIARYFTIYDDAKKNKAHKNENQSTWGVYNTMMNYNRWFMSADKKEYKDTKIKIEFKDGQITSKSKYPLAIFYYYNPNSNPTLYKKLDGKSTTFSFPVKEALKELSPEAEKRGWFNVMTIDTQGNMAYKQYKSNK